MNHDLKGAVSRSPERLKPRFSEKACVLLQPAMQGDRRRYTSLEEQPPETRNGYAEVRAVQHMVLAYVAEQRKTPIVLRKLFSL